MTYQDAPVLVEIVATSVTSRTSQRVYRMGAVQFIAWWQDDAQPMSRNLVQRYRLSLEERKLAPRTINLRLAAVRKLAEEAVAMGLLASSMLPEVLSVKGAKILGSRTGNWLTRDQARELLTLPDPDTLKGKRDRALLSLFLGSGLRREELASLAISQVQQRDGRWCLLDVIGKGKRVRTVPIPEFCRRAIGAWLEVIPSNGNTGPLLGCVNKGGRCTGQGMSASAIYAVVVEYAWELGSTFGPHDLRRTYGKLAHRGGARLEQIQLSYGHASIQTTERYLGITQDLADAPCDYLQL